MEIGIRCTKILERDGDIVTIANRQIGKVVNMTQHSSWYTCEFTVPSSVEIEELESMLQEELPKIGKRNRKIINGPYYYGILKVTDGKMTLSIMTECKEEDYNKIRRILNREVYQLLKNRQIEMK